MNDAGYTATEALAALAILGLAIGGLTGGLKVVGQGELSTSRKIAEANEVRTTAQELTDLVRGQGPFRSDEPGTFTGGQRSFDFPCKAGVCKAELTDAGLDVREPSDGLRRIAFPGAEGARFRYRGSLGVVSDWPPAPAPLPAPQWQVLQAILLEQPNGDVLAVARLSQEQAADCEFDGILQDCRKAAS